MAQMLSIHPQSPQPRLIAQAVETTQKNGVIVYPTDSGYALGCRLGDREAMERILQIRQIELSHHLTLVCHDLSELGQYAQVDNRQYRLLKQLTPGAYTFILVATKEVPRRIAHRLVTRKSSGPDTMSVNSKPSGARRDFISS